MSTAPIALGQPRARTTAATAEQQQFLDYAATLPALRPLPDRDTRGRYLLPDPDTGEARSWTRVTTFAGTLEDDYALGRWTQRMAAVGLAARPDLVAKVAAFDAPHDDPAQRAAVDDLVATAMAAAGSTLGSQLGTAMHTVTEHFDTAMATGTPMSPPPVYADDVVAYHQACQRHGIDRPAEWIERIVVVPELGVAGTFDNLVAYTPVPELVVADKKTQKTMDFGAVKIAVQLACYAHASHVWTPDGWEPMPPVRQDFALVFHMPVGSGTCVIHRVDIAAGWELAQLSQRVRKARSTAGLVLELSPVAPPEPVAPRTGPVSMGEQPAEAPATEIAAAGTYCVRCGEPAVAEADTPSGRVEVCQEHAEQVALAEGITRHQAVAEPVDPERTEWMLGRFRTLAESDQAKALVMQHWPYGVPQGPPWTSSQVDQLHEVATAVESALGAPFPAPDPANPPTVPVPAPVAAAEGTGPRFWKVDAAADGPAAADEFQRLAAELRTLDEHQLAAMIRWAKDGATGGKPWKASANLPLTVRLAAVTWAAIWCARALYDHTEGDEAESELLVRAALADVLERDLDDAWWTGALLGALTTSQADRLQEIAEAAASDPTVAAELAGRVTADQAA